MPLIVPGLVMTGLFTIIGALQVFNEPNTLLTLTNTISSDWVPMMLVWRVMDYICGKRLAPVVHVTPFWFAWAAFRPETRVAR